jgi:hypothetical protein
MEQRHKLERWRSISKSILGSCLLSFLMLFIASISLFGIGDWAGLLGLILNQYPYLRHLALGLLVLWLLTSIASFIGFLLTMMLLCRKDKREAEKERRRHRAACQSLQVSTHTAGISNNLLNLFFALRPHSGYSILFLVQVCVHCGEGLNDCLDSLFKGRSVPKFNFGSEQWRYFPKGTDFHQVSQEQVNEVVARLNTRLFHLRVNWAGER